MRSSPAQRGLPLLLLSVGLVCVGVSALIARRALTEATPLMLAAWRMGLASLFFLGVQVVQLRKRAWPAATSPRPGVIGASERWRLIIAGIALGAHFAFWFASLQLTSISVSTLLVATTPLWTALGKLILRRSSPTPQFWGALLVSIFGVFLIVRPEAAAPHVAPSFSAHAQIFGDFLATCGGAAFGIYLLAVEDIQHLAASRIVAWTYTIAAGALWLLAIVVDHPTLRYSIPVWESIVLLTVVPQVIGHTLINNALKSFQSHVVAFSLLTEPVIAAALAVLLLHDKITPVMLLGGLLVLLSLGFVLAGNSQSRSADLPEAADPF